MTTVIRINTTHYLEVAVLQKNGNFASGLVVTYEIRKSSDDTLITSGTLTEATGVYVGSTSFSQADQYRVIYTTPVSYENGFETLIVQNEDLSDISDTLNNIANNIIKILGLSQSNYRVTEQIYVSHGDDICLQSAVISIYPTATDTENETNAIARYQVEAEFDGDGKVTDYKVTEI